MTKHLAHFMLLVPVTIILLAVVLTMPQPTPAQITHINAEWSAQ